MAMNKKEQAELEKLRNDVKYLPKLVKALRWTDDKPEMDLLKPNSGYISGWNYHYYGLEGRVSKMWSEKWGHGNGDGSNRNNGSREGINLYSTKLLALKALRSEMELKFAEKLLDIDMQIELELTK